MEKRHSSPAPRASSPRPSMHRKRSNSHSMIDALGCSTPEAELILAEGRAAIRRRRPSVHKRGRRKASMEGGMTFRPQEHIQYLHQDSAEVEDTIEPVDKNTTSTRHVRIPSNVTDGSTSTVTGPAPTAAAEASPTSPLPGGQVDYSANLAKFIQDQLASIPSYKTFQRSTISPRSCPDLSMPSPLPPQSPRSPRRHVDMHHVLEMPPVRPPLKSAFSEWSSTDDETEVDEVPPLPSVVLPRQHSKASNDTPSILGYYENSHGGSFLLPSTPTDEGEERKSVVRAFTFPNPPASSDMSSESHSTSIDDDSASSDASAQPQLTTSSAPSFSSVSTASYFDYKHPIHLVPDVKNRIIAATAPTNARKVLTAISPFEGNALANVHDILVESHQRVVVEGMSFDLMNELNLPDEGMRRIQTPC
ncbi:hypothetical protein BDV96DRAFT_598409 [Lophiotrema nucula]|uniref:Uncharacterized protein n=1 Tax=Lophiotrema nucula TaxID=690887 RepID=A0A6A5ZBS9_9PLEO|nr:hypothetical protein BDV96DRAFT_598409 [Lophiotrema nucula]